MMFRTCCSRSMNSHFAISLAYLSLSLRQFHRHVDHSGEEAGASRAQSARLLLRGWLRVLPSSAPSLLVSAIILLVPESDSNPCYRVPEQAKI
ncbi:hypothetical protein BJX65DRAFT_286121 [Aspergillus insuetus]